MKTALISLSAEGAKLARLIEQKLSGADLYLHADVEGFAESSRFDRVVDLTPRIFSDYTALVYIMPCGVVVRALAGLPSSKHTDPAVLVIDVGGRHVISLLSGHEGGANGLAVAVANIIGAEPVISTTTEAVKTVIAGVGCKRGMPAEQIADAVRSAAKTAGVGIEEIRYIASADIKADEAGLIEAAESLGIPLRFISSDEIKNTRREFTCSELAQKKVDLPAVSEPVALLAGHRTDLILPKTAYSGITVALAREKCLSLE